MVTHVEERMDPLDNEVLSAQHDWGTEKKKRECFLQYYSVCNYRQLIVALQMTRKSSQLHHQGTTI